jgi:hypothetical protein
MYYELHLCAFCFPCLPPPFFSTTSFPPAHPCVVYHLAPVRPTHLRTFWGCFRSALASRGKRWWRRVVEIVTVGHGGRFPHAPLPAPLFLPNRRRAGGGGFTKQRDLRTFRQFFRTAVTNPRASLPPNSPYIRAVACLSKLFSNKHLTLLLHAPAPHTPPRACPPTRATQLFLRRRYLDSCIRGMACLDKRRKREGLPRLWIF